MISEYIREVTTQLSLPRGRRVGQPGHDIAKQYLLEQLSALELVPFRQQPHLDLTFHRDGQKFSNLIGVLKGQNPSLPPILVGAHYDSVIDAPCSDDNATAVAVTLAIAKLFQQHQLQRDLVIALFDSEEPPYFHSTSMGSTRFYQDHCQGFDFATAIIMDLIGHDVELSNKNLQQLFPGLRNLVAVTGCESQPILPGVVAAAADASPDLCIVPTLNEYVGDMSDHHIFRLAGVPFLFLSCGQGKFYHTRNDDLNWINFNKVTATAHFVEKLVLELDHRSTSNSHRAQHHDPYEFEIARIEQALGQGLPLALQAMDIGPKLRDRPDIDRFIQTLHSQMS